MRITSALLAGGLATVVLLPLGSATAATPVPGYEAERVGLFSVASTVEGELPEREGNWHTMLVSVNGADGVSGLVTDWTCPDGVSPGGEVPDDSGLVDVIAFPDTARLATCTEVGSADIANAVDDEGASLLAVRIDRRAWGIQVRGEVSVTDAEGATSIGSLRLRGWARGPAARTVTRLQDGVTRQVLVTRVRTRARGNVLGISLHQNQAEVDTSELAALTTYVRLPSARLPR
jgi:hypothetical protein